MNYTNVSFDSDGNTLNGWFMTSPDSAPTPRVPVLYNHGSGKNIAVRYRVQRYAFLLTLGVDLLTYDYPGCAGVYARQCWTARPLPPPRPAARTVLLVAAADGVCL